MKLETIINQPVLETERALKELTSREVVRIQCTDPASTVDIAALCARSGDELLRTATAPGVWIFWIQKQ